MASWRAASGPATLMKYSSIPALTRVWQKSFFSRAMPCDWMRTWAKPATRALRARSGRSRRKVISEPVRIRPFQRRVLPIVGEEFVESLVRFRLEPVHRAFDHAMDAAKIAAKLHRHGDVVFMGKQQILPHVDVRYQRSTPAKPASASMSKGEGSWSNCSGASLEQPVERRLEDRDLVSDGGVVDPDIVEHMT